MGHLDALGCGLCGGLWLDNAATTTVLERFDLDASKVARLIDAKAQKQTPTSPFAPIGQGCPICKEPLASTKYNEVTLDYCAAHGTFFDRGELQRVLAATNARTAPPIVAAPQGPSLQEIQTSVRHDLAYQNDPLGTSLLDWMTGGKDWVNRFRR